VPIAGGLALPVTVSVGTASLTHTQFNAPAELLAAADQALYRAKRNGRNRVEAERRRSQRPPGEVFLHARPACPPSPAAQ
jgi:hypothetical protein